MRRRDPSLLHSALAGFIMGLTSGCGSTGPGYGSGSEWETPIEVGAPVNTAGWEDSGMISPDGNALYFTYLRIDPITLLQNGVIRVSGPLRPGWPTTPPYDTLGAQLYLASRVQGAGRNPRPSVRPSPRMACWRATSECRRTVIDSSSRTAPERIISGHAGDPSLSLSRDLYFVLGGPVQGGYDANLMVARHR